MAREFDLPNILPRHIRKLLHNKNGVCDVPEFHTEKELGLDKNESRWGTIGVDDNYSQFPDCKSAALVQELAEHHKVNSNNIIVGNGSDELFDLLIRVFGNPGKDHVLTFSPYEPRLKHIAGLNGITLEEMPLNSLFQMSIFQVRSHYNEHTKILFLSNPNPISGVSLRGIDMIDLIEDFEGLVVLDESYIDYSPENSLLEYLETYPNLVIVQSFDYAWGMAGLRLGIAFASPQIIEVLHKIKLPFSVNTVAQAVAVKGLRVPEQKERVTNEVKIERDYLKEALQKLSFVEEVHSSDANFLLVRVEKPEQLLEYLRDERIYVTDVSQLHNCQGSLRISIGLPEENQRLLKSLREMPSKTSPTRVFFKKLGKTLQKASMFLGFFKKIIG